MHSVRWLGVSLLLTTLLVFSQTPASAQFGLTKDSRLDVKEPSSEYKIKLGEMQRGSVRVKGPDQKTNLAILKANAQFFVYRVTHEEYYDPLSKGDLKARPENKSVEGLIKDLNSSLLFPKPENSSRFTIDQGDYIVEFGAALDEAIRTVLLRNPPLLIRVNAAQLMAAAAKTGAPAHSKTVIELLNHKFFKAGDKFLPTPPEVYYYALKAAENLLAAYHPVWHLDTARLTRHSLKEDELIPLVKTLEGIVLNGPTIMDKAYVGEPKTAPAPVTSPPMPPMPKGTTPPATTTAPVVGVLDPKTMSKEQTQVFEFYRRQAVRALAKVRFDLIGTAPNEIRPAYTLAKFAVSDVSIFPAPSPHEIAEAVIGLVDVTPSSNLRVDEWAYTIARGTELMMAPKFESEENQTLPWRLTTARLGAVLSTLKRTAPSNPRFRPYAATIGKLCDVVTESIVKPIEKEDPTGAIRPTRDQLALWMEQNPPKDPSRSLFDDRPDFKLTPRQSR